jgi:hypothetical protein
VQPIAPLGLQESLFGRLLSSERDKLPRRISKAPGAEIQVGLLASMMSPQRRLYDHRNLDELLDSSELYSSEDNLSNLVP